MELLIFWILFGILSAVVAGNKGRSGVAWFFLGLLFGPLGLIFALVVSKNEAGIEAAEISSGASKKCPHCAELVKAEAVKCRFCAEAI